MMTVSVVGVIIKEGDTVAEHFYIIHGGTVSISSEGEEVVRRTVGEYFGELALLKNVPRIATVTAGPPCRIVNDVLCLHCACLSCDYLRLFIHAALRLFSLCSTAIPARDRRLSTLRQCAETVRCRRSRRGCLPDPQPQQVSRTCPPTLHTPSTRADG